MAILNGAMAVICALLTVLFLTRAIDSRQHARPSDEWSYTTARWRFDPPAINVTDTGETVTATLDIPDVFGPVPFTIVTSLSGDRATNDGVLTNDGLLNVLDRAIARTDFTTWLAEHRPEIRDRIVRNVPVHNG